MCDVYEEECSSQKIFTNGLKMGLPIRAKGKKILKSQEETHLLSSKEKFPGIRIDSVLWHGIKKNPLLLIYCLLPIP